MFYLHSAFLTPKVALQQLLYMLGLLENKLVLTTQPDMEMDCNIGMWMMTELVMTRSILNRW